MHHKIRIAYLAALLGVGMFIAEKTNAQTITGPQSQSVGTTNAESAFMQKLDEIKARLANVEKGNRPDGLKYKSVNLPEPTNDNQVVVPSYGLVVVSYFSCEKIELYRPTGGSPVVTDIDSIDENDLRFLLDCKYVYDKLTKLDSSQETTATDLGDSGKKYADKLHEIWMNGTNLNDQVHTRLNILQAMRTYDGVGSGNSYDYNEQDVTKAAAIANNATASANAATVNAEAMKNPYYYKELYSEYNVLSDRSAAENVARVLLGNAAVDAENASDSRGAEYVAAADKATETANEAQEEAIRAQQQANSAAQSAYRSQNTLSSLQNAYSYLTGLGILPENQKYPPFSVKSDIDFERQRCFPNVTSDAHR